MIGVYKIVSPINKIYIGQSINIERRWKKDYFSLKCKSQTKLYNSLKKYGPENHIFEILEQCKEEELVEKETYWKVFYKVLEIPSLCCRLDGRGGFLPKEVRDKISKSLKGRKHKEISKIKMSKNHSSSKKVYQYDLKGKLVYIWDSYSEAQRNNKGNLKNNILGKTKHAGGFIWLREEDLGLLECRLDIVNNFIHPNKGKTLSPKTKKLISNNVKGKKKKTKQTYLLENIDNIKFDYDRLKVNELSTKYKVSIPTMLEFLKSYNIYEFRKNYKSNYNGSI